MFTIRFMERGINEMDCTDIYSIVANEACTWLDCCDKCIYHYFTYHQSLMRTLR